MSDTPGATPPTPASAVSGQTHELKIEVAPPASPPSKPAPYSSQGDTADALGVDIDSIPPTPRDQGWTDGPWRDYMKARKTIHNLRAEIAGYTPKIEAAASWQAKAEAAEASLKTQGIYHAQEMVMFNEPNFRHPSMQRAARREYDAHVVDTTAAGTDPMDFNTWFTTAAATDPLLAPHFAMAPAAADGLPVLPPLPTAPIPVADPVPVASVVLPPQAPQGLHVPAVPQATYTVDAIARLRAEGKYREGKINTDGTFTGGTAHWQNHMRQFQQTGRLFG
jgi:hypothetical protein